MHESYHINSYYQWGVTHFRLYGLLFNAENTISDNQVKKLYCLLDNMNIHIHILNDEELIDGSIQNINKFIDDWLNDYFIAKLEL